MQKIMFNQEYGLQQAVFDGRKPITRREPYFGEVKNPNVGFYLEGKDKNRLALADGNFIVAKSRYAVGEVVAIAQRYSELSWNAKFYEKLKAVYGPLPEYRLSGWDNKMFVKAELMPKHIEMTNVRAERLQDISDRDCLREGIVKERVFLDGQPEDLYTYIGNNTPRMWRSPREAFVVLIDKTSGKGTWSKNPWVFVYEFILID